MRDQRNYSLLRHNTFGIDAICQHFVEVESVDELQAFAATVTEADRRLLIIGGGSNLLLTGNYPGTVLHVAIKGITPDVANPSLLRVGCGEVWDDVVEYCVAHYLYGAENLSLIPGEVGATAVQNIGAYGAEVKDIIYKVEAVEVVTGRRVTFGRDECGYGYRQSRFKQEWAGHYIITHVTYQLSTTFTPHLDYGNIRAELQRQGIDHPTARQLRDTIIHIRREKLPDPAEQGNAGSFFMNPVVTKEQFRKLQHDYPQIPHYAAGDDHEKIPAAWLIDQCGWKGRTLGAAGVYQKQPLVLVNCGGATGADVVALCRAIQYDVEQRFGIAIKPEVNIV